MGHYTTRCLLQGILLPFIVGLGLRERGQDAQHRRLDVSVAYIAHSPGSDCRMYTDGGTTIAAPHTHRRSANGAATSSPAG